jgi:hypothetical protein
MDPVSRLCAIDAVYVMTYHLSSVMKKTRSEVISGVAQIGEEIPRATRSLSSIFLHESVILCKCLSVMESLVEYHSYWEIICSSSLVSFHTILSPELHLTVENIDSVFIVCRLLAIMQKLCFYQSTATSISSERDVVHSLSRLILDGNSIVTQQVVSQRCMKYKNLILPYSGNTIQTLAVLCVDYLSLFDDCRISLIDCGISETLFQCLYQMESSHYLLTPPTDTTTSDASSSSLPPPPQLVPIEKLKLKSKERSARRSSHDNVITTLLIDILYNLSCKSSEALYTSLFQVSDVTISHVLVNCLLTFWSQAHDDLSNKILAIMLRCGVGQISRRQSSEDVKRKLSMDPWLTLISTEQVPFLSDMVSFQPPATLQWTIDQDSLSFAQMIACSAIFSLVTKHGAAKTSLVELCQTESMESYELECSPASFFFTLESFCLQYQEAALLMAEIFSWDEILYRYFSPRFAKILLQVLSNENLVSRCAVVRIFGCGILHSEGTRLQTLQGFSLTPQFARYLEEVLLVCLETVLTETSPDYIVTQQSAVVERYLEEVRRTDALIFSGETVVNAIALISALFDNRHGNRSPQLLSPFDPTCDQLLDLPLNSPQEISLQTSCCRAVLAVLSGMWERLGDLTNFSDPIVQAMWSAVLTLSSEKQSAEVLLVNGVVDVMKNWIHSLVAMKPQPEPTNQQPEDTAPNSPPKDLLLCAFQVLRSILIGFEESSAHLILLNDHILCDLTEFLYRPPLPSSSASLPREVIIHILHSLSSTSTHSTVLLSSKSSSLSPETQTQHHVEGQEQQQEESQPFDYALVDWISEEIIGSLADKGTAVDDCGMSYQLITMRRMICLLCNLSRVPGAPLRMLTHSTLIRSLSTVLTSELNSAPPPPPLSPAKKSSNSDVSSSDALWSMPDPSGTPSPPRDLENGSLLTVTLSLLNALAPSMYLLNQVASLQILPSDLLESLLLIASESTNILHIDQVSSPFALSLSLTCDW